MKTVFRATGLAIMGAAIAACAAGPRVDPDIVVMQGAGTSASNASAATVATMTYDELYRCAQDIESMENEDARLDKEHASIEASKAYLKRLGDSIDIVRPTLNKKSDAAVDAFNARVNAYNGGYTTLNKTIDEYNLAVDARKAKSTDFRAGCVGRSYRISNYKTLPLNLRQAVERNTHQGG